jgi:hypothetical protein
MSLDTRTIRAHRVPQKQAAAHAATRLHLGVYTETPGMVHWRGANLGRPQTVYDLNNQPLFYDFPVMSRLREQLGLIRTSASRVIGVPAVSTYLGETPWDVRGATAKAVDAVRKRFRGEILRTRLVCYAYPKLGIAVYWKKEGRTERTIIDIGDLSMVPEKVEPGLRGPGAWSYYGRMKKDDVPDAVKRFGLYEKLVEEVQERSRLDLSKTLRRYEFEAVQAQVAKLLKLYTTKILTFCTHGFSHECFRLHPQENGYYCVVATGQMLLDFWRYHYTQNQIANDMGTTPGGTS